MEALDWTGLLLMVNLHGTGRKHDFQINLRSFLAECNVAGLMKLDSNTHSRHMITHFLIYSCTSLGHILRRQSFVFSEHHVAFVTLALFRSSLGIPTLHAINI